MGRRNDLETMMEVDVSCWRLASSKAQTDRQGVNPRIVFATRV